MARRIIIVLAFLALVCLGGLALASFATTYSQSAHDIRMEERDRVLDELGYDNSPNH